VVQHGEPTYPPLARQARIQGDVSIKITTDGESVLNAVAETGHPLLRRAAEENVRTWKFAPHQPNSFNVVFRYHLLPNNVEVFFLQSPTLVEITAPSPELIIDYAEIGLGKWKAQLKSVSGSSQEVLDLYYSGPDGDWLGGKVTGPKDETEEIDYGHREGSLLGFAVKLSHLHERSVKVFLVGRMIGSKMTGTFIDDTGTTGEWTAVRQK
jgi:TonB family protein